MKWKETIRAYLHFTRKDRIGLMVLVGLILVVFILPHLLPAKPFAEALPEDTAWIAAVKKLDSTPARSINNNYRTSPANSHRFNHSPAFPATGELFYFDPNTLDAVGWQKLGIREKIITTILKYRNSGGRFRQPEDIARIYGLSTREIERLQPYVQIEKENKMLEIVSTTHRPSYVNTRAKSVSLEINTADTTAYISLPGIGSKLALRIVLFRNSLGGFYSIQQVSETFGIADTTFQKIKPFLRIDTSVLKKLDINNATLEQLKTHPYIRYQLARSIVNYRNEHGRFKTIEDIKKILSVTIELYDKLKYYLKAD